MSGDQEPVQTDPAPTPATGADGWFWASDAPTDGPRVEMRHRADGGMDVRTSTEPSKVLEFTRGEWLAWLDGVEHREFDHLAGDDIDARSDGPG